MGGRWKREGPRGGGVTIPIRVLQARPEAGLRKSGRRVEGFEPIHWKHWGDALARSGPHGTPQKGLLLVTEGGERLLRAVCSVRGPLDPKDVRFPCSLAQLASDHGCRWVMQVSRKDLLTLRNVRWGRGQDYLDRLLALWRALQDLQAEGRLASWPHSLDAWPALVDLAPRGLGSLCPDDHAAVAAIWRGSHVSTLLAFRRRRGRIDRIVGPGVLQPAMGLVSGDWTRDYRYLSQAVERVLGPLGLGFFAQESAVRELIQRGDAADWARAVAARDVIVSPMSAGLAVSLGLDFGRSTLRKARDLMSAWGVGTRVLTELRGLFEPEAPRPDLRDLVGIDAFSLLEQAWADLDEEDRKSWPPLAGAGE